MPPPGVNVLKSRGKYHEGDDDDDDDNIKNSKKMFKNFFELSVCSFSPISM